MHRTSTTIMPKFWCKSMVQPCTTTVHRMPPRTCTNGVLQHNVVVHCLGTAAHLAGAPCHDRLQCGLPDVPTGLRAHPSPDTLARSQPPPTHPLQETPHGDLEWRRPFRQLCLCEDLLLEVIIKTCFRLGCHRKRASSTASMGTWRSAFASRYLQPA